MTPTPPSRPVVVPHNGMTIARDTALAPGVHVLPDGIRVAADGVTIDGNGAVLIGAGRRGRGVTLDGRRGVTIRNLALREYHHGIHAANCSKLNLEHNQITATGEVAANTIFLDIWKTAPDAYGGAILLDRCEDCTIADNDVSHQMCGVQSFHCRRLAVRRNLANYNSGYGFHVYDTCESVFEDNWADYCCRYEPRAPAGVPIAADAGGPGCQMTGVLAAGHMGADATGFLIVRGSCNNSFRRNMARMGGDGFFVAGLGSDGVHAPCDENLFEENDGSLSPNIAFEATFCRGNVFRNNRADRCNFGFWLGFSSENVIEGNRALFNRQAAVAVENGARFDVRGNDFQRNGHGVLMWSKFFEEWFTRFGENRTCHHWTIENNTFTRNDKGILIGADLDHGIRPMPPESCGRHECRPHDNAIRHNDIQDNRVGIELLNADRTTIEHNTLNRNVECHLRRQDDRETALFSNLGAAGAYL